jgi:hypothetical protein
MFTILKYYPNDPHTTKHLAFVQVSDEKINDTTQRRSKKKYDNATPPAFSALCLPIPRYYFFYTLITLVRFSFNFYFLPSIPY